VSHHGGQSDARSSAGHDESRVHTTGVLWFVAGFILVGAGILMGLWGLESDVAPMAAGETGRPPEAWQLAQPLQPSPGHPALPWEDMAAMRAAQEKELHSYGATAASPAAGHVRIPIERAIDLLLQSGELRRPWVNPATQPYRMETQPAPRSKPSVENRT
jgi:hypothetical protein